MTTQTFSTAAIHVVGQYNDAGKTLVGAYRAGAHRLLGAAASRTTELLGRRELPLFDERIKGRLLGAQQALNGFLAGRLDIDTRRVVAAMDRLAAGTTRGIASLAEAASRVESPLGHSVLGTLQSLNQPLAQVSVQIADRVATGAKQIESRVAGTPTVVKAAQTVKSTRAKSRPAPRRTVRTSRKAA